MLTQMARDWWVYAVRGVAAIIFGIAALVWPGPTLEVLVYMFGALAFTDGVASLVALARGEVLARRHAWATGLSGVFGIVISIVTLFYPGMTALTLLYMVAFWAITTGVLGIVAAIEMRKLIEGEGWIIFGGLISIAFGTLLIAFPGSGLLSLVWMFGVYAIVFGFWSLGVAHRLHGIDKDLDRAAKATQAASVA